MSHVMCHVLYHVSRVTCHVSHVTFFFYGQSGEAYRWRVCYQRGLPRLVLSVCPQKVPGAAKHGTYSSNTRQRLKINPWRNWVQWSVTLGQRAAGRFHVKGPRKKVNVKKWIFFNEMWKIMGQIDDFDRFLNNSCDLGVFLAKNQKYQKMTVLKKWKLRLLWGTLGGRVSLSRHRVVIHPVWKLSGKVVIHA